jgi:hypothetical protein
MSCWADGWCTAGDAYHVPPGHIPVHHGSSRTGESL